ncbi:hypothetical protein ACWY4P_29085 [Streptomyces sp. LZ34]
MKTTRLRLPRRRAWSTGMVLGLLSATVAVVGIPSPAGADEVTGPAWKHTTVPVPGAILADVAVDKTTWTVGYSLAGDGFGFKPNASQRTDGRWSPNRAAGLPAHGRLDGVDTVGGHTWAVGTEEIPGPEEGTVIGFRALAARWDGTTWEPARLPLPQSDSAFTQLQAIDVLPNGQAWAVGSQSDHAAGTESGLVLHYDGTRWKRLTPPEGASFISDVMAVSDHSVWTTSNNQVSQWNGTRWTHTRLPAVDGAKPNLEALKGLSDRDLWAVGYTQTGGIDTRKPLALHFDGHTWTRITMPQQDKATLLDVAMTAKNRAVAVGYTPGERFYTLALSLAGARHAPVPAQSADTPGSLNGVSASRAGLWTVGAVTADGNQQPVAAHVKPTVGTPAADIARVYGDGWRATSKGRHRLAGGGAADGRPER